MEKPMRIIAHPSPEGFDNERTKMSHEFIDWAMMTYEQALEHLGDHIKEVCEPKTLGYYDQLLTAIKSCSVRDKEVNPFDRKAFAAFAHVVTDDVRRKLLDLLDEKSIKPDDFQMNLVTTQLRAWEVQVGSSERDRAHKMQGRKLHA